ncbi:AAA family ATPase [Dolichospermum flos-aquae]|uniref:ATP-binding protein n=1 Tax=Dolichospermum flos-aquae CCAP 1403/13F TaxID=315271 RepID=A0A6H2C606_DOLFA|nr:AAA family ATPase [Dolichospermum flos-aquae]QJB46434.1 ATP-binding protein [Dolichospermum flos-aquae CCAP 1403/13F]
MQRISIENFGPVKKFEADVTDIMLLIGPQASGKSTISKSIFIFKSIKDEIIDSLYNSNLEQFKDSMYVLLNHIKINFLKYFGLKQNCESFCVKYQYSNDKHITIYKSDNHLNIKLSLILEKELKLLVTEILNYKIIFQEQQNKFKSLEELREIESDKRLQFKNFKSRIDKIFEETHSSVFIPAGRSLMSTLTDQLQEIKNPDTLDYFTKSFVERINLLKTYFTNDLNTLIQNKDVALNLADDLSRLLKKILKGEYRFNADIDKERIYFKNNQYVKLQYASSGQQESVWILLLIFRYILDETSVSVIFEEPEAHLYPETQSDIVELIGLLANVYNNQIIITTHSPYILSAFNNLLYAYQVGKNKIGDEREAVESIVNSKSWIDPNRISAYFISENGYESIIDEELKLIQAEKIDSASSIINNKFNDLFNLDE